METANTYLISWFFLIAAISISFSVSAIKKRTQPGYIYLIFLFLISGIIYLLSSVNLFIRSANSLIIIDYSIDTLIALVPILWFFFAVSFSQNKKILENPDLALLFIIPIITVLNIWTNDYNAFWYTNRVLSKTAYGFLMWIEYQDWFWVHYAFSNILFFIGMLYIFSAFSRTKRKKLIALICITFGFIAVTAFEFIQNTGLVGNPGSSVVLFLYSLIGLLLLLFIYRIDLFNVAPFTRQAIFDQISDYIVVLDNQNRIIDANIAFATWKGIPKADLYGESLFAIFPQWSKEHPLLKEDKNITCSEAFLSSSGDQFIEIDSLPLIITGQRMYGRLLVFHDITVLSQNASMKIDFINTISHELRTPLTVIKQAVSYLNSEQSVDIDPEQKKVLGIAHRNADRLNHMVNNLLEFQNLRLGKETLRFESYSYNGLIQDSLLVLKPWIDQGHIRIIEELEPMLPKAEMDVDKMKQVIVNIIDNAIRYTEKGFVVIRTSDFTSFARIIVEDTGIGLTREEKSRLDCSLDEFELSIQKNRSHIGLGLIISKEIIHQHNGSIMAKTKTDGGTIITIDLPYTQSSGT